MIRFAKRIRQGFSRGSDTPSEQAVGPQKFDPKKTDPALVINVQPTMPVAAVQADNFTVPTQTASRADFASAVHDTQPGRVVDRGTKLSSDETNPRNPFQHKTEPDTTGLPEPSDAPMPIFGTPHDPYAGLFPPAAPDDDDYLETSLLPPEESLPPDFPGMSHDSPQPPDSLPL